MATTVIAALALALALTREVIIAVGWIRRRRIRFRLLEVWAPANETYIEACKVALIAWGGASAVRIDRVAIDFFETGNPVSEIGIFMELPPGEEMVFEPQSVRRVRFEIDRQCDAGHHRSMLPAVLSLTEGELNYELPFNLHRTAEGNFHFYDARSSRPKVSWRLRRMLRRARKDGRPYSDPPPSTSEFEPSFTLRESAYYFRGDAEKREYSGSK